MNRIKLCLFCLALISVFASTAFAQKIKKKPVKKAVAKSAPKPTSLTICDGDPFPEGYTIDSQSIDFDCMKRNQTGKMFTLKLSDGAKQTPHTKNSSEESSDLTGDINPKPPCIESDGPDAGKPCKKKDSTKPQALIFAAGATTNSKIPNVVSAGVVNGKATNLVQPVYPAAAKAVHAGGEVQVQVLIDEQGKVISASASSGNPLLRATAVQAARLSKFVPIWVSGKPVKVRGVVVYNISAQ